MSHRFSVSGMSCAACSARVEKAVSGVPGVSGCTVSLLTNSMRVEGGATDEAIIAAVEKAGYRAAREANPETSDQRPGGAPEPPAGAPDDRAEARGLRRRLLWSLALLAVLMYGSMGHMMLGWPLPRWFTQPEPNHVAMGIAQLLLAGAVLILNGRFFTNGFRGLVRGAPNMDTLVALGAGSAFAWSTAVLFLMTRGQLLEGVAGAERWMDQYYFESAAMIVTLITVGKMLEARAKGRTTSALRALLALVPKTATVVRDGREQAIPAAQVRVGDIFLVRPGENVPVDGVVEEGEGAVDESALTGESVPVDKVPGAAVSAATANRSGFLRCRATRVGADTTLAQIARLVSDAAATKAPVAQLADRVSAVFVPAILLVALLALGAWFALGAAPGFALARAIAVLVVSCPCALGLATPVAIMVGSGVGARRGILFKTAAALEAAGRVRTVVLDKTGTITAGEPEVVSVFAADENGDDRDERKAELLAFAAALERGSEHPLAKAVVRAAAGAEPAERRPVESFRALPGCGVEATIGGEPAFGGSVAAAEARGIALPSALRAAAEEAAGRGATPLVFARGGNALGLIAVADAPKPDAAESIRDLRGMGLRVLLLTGDNERTARAVAAGVGIDEVVAGVLPDGKHRLIEALAREGRVAMVGDGVNDAPALAAADLGLAIGAGTDVAIDAADAVLVHSRLADVVAALRLGRATLRNIRENLFWAFAYNVLLIPLAAGALYPLFGWKMHPDLGALAMSLSSFCVVSNALRLNFAKLGRGAGAPATDATRSLSVTGMMCAHCEKRVREVLEAVPGVSSATADHRAGVAVVSLASPVADAALVAAVEAAGYRAAVGAPRRMVSPACFAAILAALLAAGWTLHRLLGVNVLALIPSVDGATTLAALFAAGLLTSLHCAGMCGALLLGAVAPRAPSPARGIASAAPVAVYNLARVVAYAAVGAFAGALGHALPVGATFRGTVQVVAGVAMLLMSLHLLGYVRLPRLLPSVGPSAPAFGRFPPLARAAALGLATGLMPCGPLQAMQLWALGSGSAVRGALGMLCFGLGTSPLLLAFGALASALARRRALVSAVASALMALLAAGMLVRGLRAWGVAPPPVASALGTEWLRPSIEDGVQVIRFDLEWDRVPDIAVEAGKPVKLVVNAAPEKITGCNNEFYSEGLGFRLHISPGENAVTFTPAAPGSYAYACWMDMLGARIHVEEAASPFLTLAPGEDGFIAVPLARISDKALYVNVPKEEAPLVQLLAIRDGAGNARIAFNTCQACSPSPRAWFAQRDDGRLVCQNCGNDFGPEAVGAAARGCNPTPIPGVRETPDALVAPTASIEAARPAFTRWAGPRE